MWLKALNFVCFQIGWFACVLSAAAGRPWIGPVVVAFLLAVHLAWRRPRRAEIVLLVFAAAFGYSMDSLLVLAGAIDFPPASRLGQPSTVWMVAMWMNLATTLNASLGWLRGRYGLAAVMGLVAGPLSYYAGVRLEAISFGLPTWLSLAAIGVEWTVSMPALLAVAALARPRGTTRGEPGPAGLSAAEVQP